MTNATSTAAADNLQPDPPEPEEHLELIFAPREWDAEFDHFWDDGIRGGSN